MLNPARILPNHAEQGVLFSEHFVGDRLPSNHAVYAFKELLQKLDLTVLEEDYSREGGHMFAPRDLFAVVSYGYTKGICSSYQLADAVAHRLDFIFLAGGHAIKRRTLSDFRARHRAAMARIFLQTVELADKVGLIDRSKVFALDGTKIRASANKDQRKQRNEWIAEREKLKASIEDFLDRWDKNDAEEEELEEKEAERIRKIRERIAALPKQKLPADEADMNADQEKPAPTPENPQQAQSVMNRIEKIDRALERTDTETINLTDPDSRVMKQGAGTNECYNVQAISNNSVIVALNVTQEENDQRQLRPMTEQLLKNIPVENSIHLVADAGYNAGKNLAYLETQPDVDAYISMFERKEAISDYDRKKFLYDELRDEYICPRGKALETLRETKHGDEKHTLYGARLEDCIYCPARNACLTSKADIRRGYRTIEDDAYAPLRHAMRSKIRSADGREIYRQRGGEIEPRFGWKKRITLPQFRLRGLRGVTAEAALSSIANNIVQILKGQTLAPAG